MSQVSEGVMKRFGSDILCGIAIPETPRDVRVDAIEVKLVEVTKAGRILLRRFD
jgi:hypothetical protein